MNTFHSRVDSPLGELLLTSRDGKLTGLYFQDQAHAPRPGADWIRQDDLEIFSYTAGQVEAYAAGESTTFDLPLGLSGTPFQVQVWNAIGRIPFGRTLSYGELAVQIGSPNAVRAVGTAAGANPVCWIVPCHRVVGANGALTGYAGGLERKRRLLDFEAGRSVSLEALTGESLAAA